MRFRRATSSSIVSSDGRDSWRLAASSTFGSNVTSPTVFRKTPGRPSTQCTARSMSSCSRSGSYQVELVYSRPSQGASVIALIVCIATPRSAHIPARVSKSDA